MQHVRTYHSDRTCHQRYKREEHTKGPCDETKQITFWLDSHGCWKNFELPSDFYTMIVTNPIIATWPWLLFTIIMSVMWAVLFSEHIIHGRINEIAFRYSFYIISAMTAAFYVVLTLRRKHMAASFNKICCATRAIMLAVQTHAVPAVVGSDALVEIVSHNNDQYVLKGVPANMLPKRLAIVLNALIVARRRAMLCDLQPSKLPLYADQIAELCASGAAPVVDTLYAMASHLVQVMVNKKAVAPNFESGWLLKSLQSALCASADTYGLPRIFVNGAWWTKFVLSILVPLLFASIYDGYAVVWIAPIVLNFYFVAFHYACAQCDMMVQHRSNMWSDIEMMRNINCCANDNYATATTISRMFADFKNPPSDKPAAVAPPPTVPKVVPTIPPKSSTTGGAATGGTTQAAQMQIKSAYPQ